MFNSFASIELNRLSRHRRPCQHMRWLACCWCDQ